MIPTDYGRSIYQVTNSVSDDMVEKWLRGWSLSRGLPLPVRYKSGFKVDVGHEKQKARYVFSELNEDFIQLSKSIDESRAFLKVCAAPDEVSRVVGKKWVIQPQGYMMVGFQPLDIPKVSLASDFRVECENYDPTFLVKILTQDNQLASQGRVVLVEDFAVFDRITTEVIHRRKGLATFVMIELEKIAFANDVFRKILVATEDGKNLYQSLGLELYSFYTSIVVPA